MSDAGYCKIIKEKEEKYLNDKATKSFSEGAKRDYNEEDCKYRTPFQRDRDRIIHSKAFRRLMHKTQVFVKPDSEHIRTRLTHSLEVMQIARTIARCVSANEDLVEAVALGHDLGHTPFGHIGEEAINEKLLKFDLFFQHNIQSWRIVNYLEKYDRFLPQGGLNLTQAVKFGILRHSGKYVNNCEEVEVWDKDGKKTRVCFKQTLEEKIVRIADDIAWLNHDWEDGIKSGLLSYSLLSENIIDNLGIYQYERINNMVIDVIEYFNQYGEVKHSQRMEGIKSELKIRIKKYLWESEMIKRYNKEAKRIIGDLFDFFLDHPDKLPNETRDSRGLDNFDDKKKIAIVCADYISGMTDSWCLKNYESYIYSPYSIFKLQLKEKKAWITLDIEKANYELKEIPLKDKPEDLEMELDSLYVVCDFNNKKTKKRSCKLRYKGAGSFKLEEGDLNQISTGDVLLSSS